MAAKTERFAARRLLHLGDIAWAEFVTILDRPVPHKPKLAELFAEPSIFDAPE